MGETLNTENHVSPSSLFPAWVLRQWRKNPIDCLGGTRSDHLMAVDQCSRPRHMAVWQRKTKVETRTRCDELSLPAEAAHPGIFSAAVLTGQRGLSSKFLKQLGQPLHVAFFGR